jgi:hypothetical protein
LIFINTSCHPFCNKLYQSWFSDYGSAMAYVGLQYDVRIVESQDAGYYGANT